MKPLKVILVAAVFLIVGWFVLTALSADGTSQNTVDDATHVIRFTGDIGGSYTLIDENGQKTDSIEAFGGKLQLIFFGFTFCPDICPLGLQNMTLAYNKLPADIADDVQMVFISVDPERDTPEVLKQYTDLFHPNIVGLTGSVEQIEAVKKTFKVFAEKTTTEEASDYLINHSSFGYLMDADGKTYAIFRHPLNADAVAHTIVQAHAQRFNGALIK